MRELVVFMLAPAELASPVDQWKTYIAFAPTIAGRNPCFTGFWKFVETLFVRFFANHLKSLLYGASKAMMKRRRVSWLDMIV